MSQLSSLSKRVVSGPLSVEVTEEASVLAQFCHFWRCERVVEWVGGLRKSGVWGFREVGEEDEMGWTGL